MPSDDPRDMNAQTAEDSGATIENLPPQTLDEQSAEQVKGGSITKTIDVASTNLYRNATSGAAVKK